MSDITPTARSVGVSRKGDINLPAEEAYVSVPLKDWRQCMKRIERGTSNPGLLENAAWCLLGIGGGALCSVASLVVSVEFSKVRDGVEQLNWAATVATVLMLVLTVCGLGIGGTTLYHSRDKRRMQAAYLGDVVEDMRSHERRCVVADQSDVGTTEA